MTKAKLIAACAALGAVIAQSPEAKAEPMTHDGFYMSLQAGFGYLSTSTDFDETLSGVTYSSAVMLGGTVGPVVIGGGFTYDNAFSPTYKAGGQEVDLDDVKLYLLGFGGFADIYVDPAEGLHFPIFLGWGGLEASVNGNVGGSDPTGLVVAVGGGYDFWVADEWSVGPLARFTYAPLKLNDASYNTKQFTVVADIKFH